MTEFDRLKSQKDKILDRDNEALEVGRYVLKMMALIEAQGGTFKYLAVTPNEKVLALAEKFTPEEEKAILEVWDQVKEIKVKRLVPAARSVPDGWKLVPSEPTEGFPSMAQAGAAAMWEQCKDGLIGHPQAIAVYKAMLDAAPSISPDGGEGWRPISEAPKDGSNILTYNGNGGGYNSCGSGADVGDIAVAAWCSSFGGESRWFLAHCCDGVSYNKPTHWMPLPKGPDDEN